MWLAHKAGRGVMTTTYLSVAPYSVLLLGLLLLMVALPLFSQSNTPRRSTPSGKDGFASVNGIKLHYVDWGGAGETLLFLTGLGDSAHAFDFIAPTLADRFRVLGLTRRGQDPSDKPASGYDPRSLADDIRAFIDIMKIERVTLVGYSAAGPEETIFASRYPKRVHKLVYLDAIDDRKSAHELFPKYPLPLPTFEGPLAAIVKGAERADSDYKHVTASALAFVTVPDTPYIPTDSDTALREQLVTFWNKYERAYRQRKIDHFRRDMKHGTIIELHNREHGDFVDDQPFQMYLSREIRKFLSDE